MNRKLSTGLFVACCVWASGSIPSRAATVAPMSLTDKVAAAELIVHARCTGTSTAWRDGMVFTRSEFSVVDDLRGLGTTNLILVVPGGTAVHPILKVPVTTRLSDGVRVQADDEVILFARRNASGEYRLVAGGQTYLRLVRDPAGLQRVRTDERRLAATPAAAGQSARSSSTAGVTDIDAETYAVDDFKARIRWHLMQSAPEEERQ